MHYLTLGWKHRTKWYSHGVPMISMEPNEDVRGWAWEQGIRYTIKIVSWENNDQLFAALWIGFYTDDDAFAFKMRWG
jgi:hypothetical protein